MVIKGYVTISPWKVSRTIKEPFTPINRRRGLPVVTDRAVCALVTTLYFIQKSFLLIRLFIVTQGKGYITQGLCCLFNPSLSSPGYGTRPLVTSSVSKMPNDHTSDLMVNFPYSAASGAVHLIGNFAPGGEQMTCA